MLGKIFSSFPDYVLIPQARKPTWEFGQLLSIFIPIIHLETWEMTLGSISQTWAKIPFISLYTPTLTGNTMTLWVSMSTWTLCPQSSKYLVIPLFPVYSYQRKLVPLEKYYGIHIYHGITWSSVMGT